MLQPKQWSIEWGGRTLTIETGRLALQALASCTVRYGDTMVLATVMKSNSTRPGIDYFPLMVDFEEKLYAAGKIKGSRFIKREGRPSDMAILSARLIDRAIRPLFDDSTRTDIQVIITPLSVDGEQDTAAIGLIAASVVLSMSSIVWNGPIAAARIGVKDDGSFMLNMTSPDFETHPTLDLLIAGTTDKLIMTEATSQESSESVMYEAITWGCAQLAPVIELISRIQAEVGLPKETTDNTEQSDTDRAREALRAWVASQADTTIFDTPKISKSERTAVVTALKESGKVHLTEAGFAEEVISDALTQIKTYVAEIITRRILDSEQRLDGRALTDIRELECGVDILPRVHGSAMFMRGDTQVLSVVTLGSPGDVQTLDSMEEEGTKRYMHHYNDAPYTYGEVSPLRGPGRRAIGHGALAERALEPVLPDQASFPYAIRVVSEVMGSNGSSSMASTCGSTLSLMAAGVPLKKPVAGIAMGLASDESGAWKVLTDLQDIEDGVGGMDFKIAGTRDGISVMQMDTKTQGLTFDIVKQTLTQAHEARLRILDTMGQTLPASRDELSPYAPRIETLVINPDRIRDVIGPGGKVINKIIEDTGVQIDIEQDGRIMITSSDGDAMQKAKKIIEDLTHEIQAGEEYEGKVVRLEDFGAFVEILPGKDGLVHVSEIAWERTNKPGDVLNLGDVVKVKVKEIDNLGRVNLSMRILKPKPEGYVEPPPRDDSRPPRRTGGFDRNNRGGGRGPRRP